MDRGARKAAVHGVTKSWTRLSSHVLYYLKMGHTLNGDMFLSNSCLLVRVEWGVLSSFPRYLETYRFF